MFRTKTQEDYLEGYEMKLTISDEAVKWYESEMGISPSRGVRFLGKVYGKSPIHDGFSLAVEVFEPNDPLLIQYHDDIPFFIEKADEWFFEGHDLAIEFDEKKQEPVYHYLKDGNDYSFSTKN